MMILKTVVAGAMRQQFLYTNIRVDPEATRSEQTQMFRLRQSCQRWDHNKARALAALIFANFDSSAWFTTLTFNDVKHPDCREDCARRWRYFVSKLRRSGVDDIKYIKSMEHKTSKNRRWHIHAIMQGMSKLDIERCWIYGHADIEPADLKKIYSYEDCGRIKDGFARYITKEAPDKVGQRVFQTSRGLTSPFVFRDVVDDCYQLYVPKDCDLIERNMEVVNAYGYSASQIYIIT